MIEDDPWTGTDPWSKTARSSKAITESTSAPSQLTTADSNQLPIIVNPRDTPEYATEVTVNWTDVFIKHNSESGRLASPTDETAEVETREAITHVALREDEIPPGLSIRGRTRKRQFRKKIGKSIVRSDRLKQRANRRSGKEVRS